MYDNREQAGAVLSAALRGLDLHDPVVLALPRGGVPVARIVAADLGAPLDLILVRKIGVPGHRELAAGALADGPPEQIMLNDAVMRAEGLSRDDLTPIIEEERARNVARRAEWLGGRAAVPLTGRSAVVVDDGIATGATMRAALAALRARAPREIILAVPVAARDTLAALRRRVDHVICPLVPERFQAVGLHYRDFGQVDDTEVARLMAEQTGKDER